MDLTVRDWMVIVGILLIMAVLLDAWRRVRSERYSRVKVKLADPEGAGPDPERAGAEADANLAWLKELPNGGGRVVERGDLLKAAGLAAQAAPGVSPDKASVQTRRRSGSTPSAQQSQETPAAAGQSTAVDDTAVQPPSDEVELITGMSGTNPGEDEPGNMDWLDGIGSQDPQDAEPVGEPDAGRLPRDVDPEVFMLNVVSRKPAGFRGEDILHILLACDLRFGDMNFFHRHEFEAGRGAIQFSVANMMQPGVFDIDNMADMNTPGLVFFLTLPGPEDMMKAFDYMLETAQAVARNLTGDVLDESRSVLTRQTMDHCRQQIRDLERRLLAKAR